MICRRLFLALSVAAAIGCTKEPSKQSVGRLTVAEGTQPIAAPVYVAYAKGFFKDQNLEVELLSFPTGRQSLEAVTGGKADIATVAETPIMHAAFSGFAVRVLATMLRSTENTYLVASRAQGIRNPADLLGKTIAVPSGTNAEYALSAFLAANALKPTDVKPLNMAPSEMLAPLRRGEVAAIVGWQPHIGRAERSLGSDTLVMSFASVYEETYNLVSMEARIAEKRELIERFLHAIEKAVEFIHQNPQEAVQIVSARIGMEPNELSELWGRYRFGLDLQQSLVETLRKQGAWAATTRQHDGTPPEMSRLIYREGLSAVAPGSVSLIDTIAK